MTQTECRTGRVAQRSGQPGRQGGLAGRHSWEWIKLSCLNHIKNVKSYIFIGSWIKWLTLKVGWVGRMGRSDGPAGWAGRMGWQGEPASRKSWAWIDFSITINKCQIKHFHWFMNKIIRWNLKNFISNKNFLGKMSNKKVSNLNFIFHIFFFYFQFLFLAVL